ncbi:MAG: UDP-N-acetylmuramate--L-alanine ligase [bacterium]|nr:UDP-N-acetylmuramate--L-alanine ligase [bacterium]MDT8365039.1 UDP-N-acetylmuramate--L-alanine ligase [bacterium]
MVKLRKTRHIHFVGIGGIGMSGIAEVLANLGYEVTGSDLVLSDTTRHLVQVGCQVTAGHAAENVGEADVVVISSAVKDDNPEVIAARHEGIPVVPRAAMLNELMRMKYGIAIAGSHGKTTTTSMVATIMAEAGLDPTVVIGGKLGSLGTNARLGEGDFLLAEADESDGSFLQLTPTIAVVTNIDNEHMDYYGTFDELRSAFRRFLDKVPFYGRAILCVDDIDVAGMLADLERPVITYGLTAQADVRASDIAHEGFTSTYVASLGAETLGEVRLPVPGVHNVYNSLAAIAVGLEMEVPFEVIARALASYSGTQRRFQKKGEAKGISIYDDYAHHPAEISATLGAARIGWKGRVIALFQPHRFSRTRDLLQDFGMAFHNADRVLVCDIYAAGEKQVDNLTGENVAGSITNHGHRSAEYVGPWDEAVKIAVDELQEGDLLLTLGAGDIWKAGEQILERLGK